MADVPLDCLMGQIRGLALAATDAGQADHELLARYAADRDEAAFAALLHRHGSLVWGLCRRLLPQRADAEDAFQATFLVLARNPRAVRRGASLGSWLYGVARRVAVRLARKARAARARDAQARTAVPPGPDTDLGRAEAQAVLDEELGRLPEKYRAPLLLCYLEGLTQDEAARQLGWAPGVLRGRLDRGRLRLRARLLRRGLAPTAVLLGVALTASPAPATLAVAVVKAACGRACPSPTVIALTEGVLRAMLVTKLKAVTVVAVVVGLTGLFAFLSVPTSAQGLPGRAATAEGGESPARPADLERRVAELEKRVLALTNLVDDLRARARATPTPGQSGHTGVAPRTFRETRPAPATARALAPGGAVAAPSLPSAPAALAGWTKPPIAEPPVLRTYGVNAVDADEVVRALDKVFEGKSVRASGIARNKSVLVYAPPSELRLVEEVIKTIEEATIRQRNRP